MLIFPFWPCPSVLQFATEKTLGDRSWDRVTCYLSLKRSIFRQSSADTVYLQNFSLFCYCCYFISRHALSLLHHSLCLSRYTFCRAFLTTLNELNDYAGQHEVIAENLTSQIISELSRFLQELKTDRKSVRRLFFVVSFPFVAFGFSVFICLSWFSPQACVLNVSCWRPTVIVREAKQKHYNRVFSLSAWAEVIAG